MSGSPSPGTAVLVCWFTMVTFSKLIFWKFWPTFSYGNRPCRFHFWPQNCSISNTHWARADPSIGNSPVWLPYWRSSPLLSPLVPGLSGSTSKRAVARATNEVRKTVKAEGGREPNTGGTEARSNLDCAVRSFGNSNAVLKIWRSSSVTCWFQYSYHKNNSEF